MTVTGPAPSAAGAIGARIVAWILAVLGAVAVLFPFGPRESLAVSLALVLPALALVLLFLLPNAFDATSRRTGRPYLDLAPLVGGLFLFAFATSAGVYDWRAAAAPAALAALLLALLGAALVAPRVRIALPLVALYCATAGAAYGYGALILADVRLDHAPPQVFETRVADRWISYGRHRSYHLRLDPFGPRALGVTASVSAGLYNATQVGDTICAADHPGLLRLAWWSIAPCPGA